MHHPVQTRAGLYQMPNTGKPVAWGEGAMGGVLNPLGTL